jgi:hypothetical protein
LAAGRLHGNVGPASLENAANFTQASGSVRSFMPAEIPHGDDPTDDAQTSDDIGVENHL